MTAPIYNEDCDNKEHVKDLSYICCTCEDMKDKELQQLREEKKKWEKFCQWERENGNHG